jgi:hypothetical protein
VLPDGRVVIFGGADWEGYIPLFWPASHSGPIHFDRAEIYDPRTETSVEISDTPYPLNRNAQTIALPSGSVLITAPQIGEFLLGRSKAQNEREIGKKLTALVYRPRTNSYIPLFNLRPVRGGASMNLLPDGRILVIGGFATDKEFKPKEHTPLDYEQRYQQSHRIQIFDPEQDQIKNIGQLPFSYSLEQHTTTALGSHRFLIVGGVQIPYITANKWRKVHDQYSKDILVYDLRLNKFSVVGHLNYTRVQHTTVPLGNERFLVVGGISPGTIDDVSHTPQVGELELFDLKTGRCTVVGSFSADPFLRAAPLRDGRSLLISGCAVGVFDPQAQTTKTLATLRQHRGAFFVISAADGQIYILGGWSHRRPDRSVKRFDYLALMRMEEHRQ